MLSKRILFDNECWSVSFSLNSIKKFDIAVFTIINKSSAKVEVLCML